MQAYFGIFKEPRGLIRLLQFIFAIFAFATACSGSSSVSIKILGPPEGNINASWSYPYNLKDTEIRMPNDTRTMVSDSNDIKSSAEFFVFTGVTSMILTLVFLLIYIFLDQPYRNDGRISLADFTITIIWTIFWLAGSSAWAQGVSNIRSQTSWENVAQRSNICGPSNAGCKENFSGTYANVIVSVIFGFLNFLLWVGSIWFVCKETHVYKSRSAQHQQEMNFSNVGSPSMQAPPPARQPGSLS